MTKRIYCILGLLVISVAFYTAAQTFNSRDRLLRSVSTQKIVETARDHQWSLGFTKREPDTLHIIAIRVDFRPARSDLITGDGRFGIQGDARERKNYDNNVYTFDLLPHDSVYFAEQLTALRNYYSRVSRGNLTLDFSIYPAGSGETGYTLDTTMTFYSPGWKRRNENINQYWDRKTHGLMMFVRDALKAADRAPNSPFRGLYRDDNGILRDTTGRRAAILILRAGASYLTDGGLEGAAAANSPSDMIDAFIDRDFFRFFQDTLGLDSAGGVLVNNHTLVINEVMMAPETSNQDGLNWGIQGILVNQVARQLGIPDLFSTSSGISAIGAFCIMDFAGYSAGQGFIPPYPSAWVRAFMGWDTPRVAAAGGNHRVKALTSVLDRGDFGSNGGDDTTILLIPLNNNEYYLVENRQRNLSGDNSLFRFDMQQQGGGIINSYPFNVNISSNAKTVSGCERNVILETKNNDISLPASGILVWHVDERIIRQRLAHNFVNADSSYRGVRLVEADGINDLGVTFTDAFYQAAFDYGGAEDVFPHRTRRNGRDTLITSFGPHTRPSTRANDGGHTYLNIRFDHATSPQREERMMSLQNNTVTNFSDSLFIVNIEYDHIVQGWSRRAAPENFFDPLITQISSNSGNDTVLTLLSESGRLYLFSINGGEKSYGSRTADINFTDYRGKPVSSGISVTYFDSIPGVFTFPTAIDGRIFIPYTQNNQHGIYVYNTTNINDRKNIALPTAPTSYICGINNGAWAVGLADGRVIIGINEDIADTVRLNSNAPVNAIAALGNSFAVIQNDGILSEIIQYSIRTPPHRVDQTHRNRPPVMKALSASDGYFAFYDSTRVLGIAPFTLATGDLSNNGESQIVVTDSRQGVWVYTRDLKLAPGWRETPNDWANTYHIDPERRPAGSAPDRNRFAKNLSAPALADLSRDGTLDIIIGGTNGIYALNRRGALLSRWPAYLDNRYWYQRGSISSSPIVVSAGRNQPLVLFSSPTGENATFGITKIETADKSRGVVTFRRDNGTLDSLWDLSAATIDTILTIGDSLIYPFILLGGFVDALGSDARRPLERIGSWAVPQSRWPLSAGAPITTSPLAYRAAANTIPDLFAVSSDGMVYRWRLPDMMSDSLYWAQTGFNAARSFAYGGPITGADDIDSARAGRKPIEFWNFPNPTSRDDRYTTFKYQFNGQATNVRLDIHTITGHRMDTFRNLSGDFPGWNEHRVDLRRYGPGIYRCRMEATINGKKYSKTWKMAVVK